jgi:hypothetical protein
MPAPGKGKNGPSADHGRMEAHHDGRDGRENKKPVPENAKFQCGKPTPKTQIP